ncbi:sterile alpha motif domain-containing protein 13 isoform X2 [Oryctolagus cuniculus]|uniref:sterile alpha motif domain-containing protein 13 isoform X2 n=1 Tax=Oryctolagus cuniculus TaxID=9986 RepID=UPI00222F3B21|nr:sterile alpha motif domain-containing protein 13 isoform X2 [Oryctolagus cuniculus]
MALSGAATVFKNKQKNQRQQSPALPDPPPRLRGNLKLEVYRSMPHLPSCAGPQGVLCSPPHIHSSLTARPTATHSTHVTPTQLCGPRGRGSLWTGCVGSVENGRPPDPADWAVMDVVNYFRTAGFEEQANVFQEQEIDGKSLLLMTRNDVLTGLQLKLGPALKIYEYHVKPLQTKHLKNSSS